MSGTPRPETPPQPVPPDKGQQPPRREPPGSPGGPPADPATPPKGDPKPLDPPKLVR